MEMSGQLHAPVTLSRDKSPRYGFRCRVSGTQSQSGHGDEEKESLPLSGVEARSCSS